MPLRLILQFLGKKMKIIVHRNKDGSVSVTTPVADCGLTFDQILAKDIPKWATYAVMKPENLPKNRLFRNSWELTDDAVGVVFENLTKAKNIAHEVRRVQRDNELKPLDLLVTIPAQAVKAEKDRQVIRDKYTVMQTKIEACINTDDLIKVISQ
jgi:vacuolar-type H+-ATPase subunit F/Vma7